MRRSRTIADLQKPPRVHAANAPLFGAIGGGAPNGHVILVGGARGAGKSTECARAIGAWVDARRGRRGYWLDAEQGEARVRGVFQVARVTPTALRAIEFRSAGTIGDALEVLRAVEKGACVVVDSLHALARGDRARRAGSKKILAASRKSGALVILICRVSREGSIAGVSDVEYDADAVVFVEKGRLWADKCRWAVESEVLRSQLPR